MIAVPLGSIGRGAIALYPISKRIFLAFKLAVPRLLCWKLRHDREPSLSMNAPLRIAMWSGPRNISTALMRAWGNRPDTVVVDEPFYACYLKATGADHPGADEVIARGETDWRKVVACLTSDRLQSGRQGPSHILYQKQMTHHLLPEISRDWLACVTNCFLIRDPCEVIASYLKKEQDLTLADLGFKQQAEIFDWVRTHTIIPPVIDARDLSENPEHTLRLLCDAVGVEFTTEMLSWPAGPRETDGVWAKHWYAEVERSTSFQPSRQNDEPAPERLRAVYQQCSEIYQRLREHRLR